MRMRNSTPDPAFLTHTRTHIHAMTSVFLIAWATIAPVQEDSNRLMLSGKVASTHVKVIDGIAFVPVSDIARALGQSLVTTVDGYEIGKERSDLRLRLTIGAALEIEKSNLMFVAAIVNHDFRTAAAQGDPSVRDSITAARIKTEEDAIEKELGPLQPPTVITSDPNVNGIRGSAGKLKFVEYIFNIRLRYRLRAATLSLRYRSNDLSMLNTANDISRFKIMRKLTSFKITPDDK